MKDPRTNESLGDLILPTLREAEWIAKLLERASDPEAQALDAAEELRCCGCGAPFAAGVETHAVGSVCCEFCGAGFVVGTRELSWPPLVLPCPETAPGLASQEPARMRRKRGRGIRRAHRSWELRHGRRTFRRLRAASTLFASGYLMGMIGTGVLVLGDVEGIGLFLFVTCSMFFALVAYMLFVTLLMLFGREEIGIDDATCWRLSRLGRFNLSSWVMIPTFHGSGLSDIVWKPAAASLPLVRLTGFEIRREHGYTKLTLSTPSCEFEAEWQLDPGEDLEFRRELTIQLAESMRALGREVVLEKVYF